MATAQQWINESGLNKRQISKRSGLARTTIDRLISGSDVAKVDTLRELAMACGVDIKITSVPLSDPFAAEAARVLLEEGYVPSDAELTSYWVERLQRWCGDDPASIIHEAALAANPRERESVRVFPSRYLGFLADLPYLWAVSGPFVYSTAVCEIAQMVLRQIEAADAEPQVAADSHPAPVGLDLEPDRDLVLVPVPEEFFFGSTVHGGMRHVSDIQSQMDALFT